MPQHANDYLAWDGPPIVLRLSNGRREPAGAVTLDIVTVVWPHLGEHAGNMLYVRRAVDFTHGFRAVAHDDCLLGMLTDYQSELRQIEATCDGDALLSGSECDLRVSARPEMRGAAIVECVFQKKKFSKSGKEITAWPENLQSYFRAHDSVPTFFRCAAICEHEALVGFIRDFDVALAAIDALRADDV
jgi:hypothetical protein